MPLKKALSLISILFATNAAHGKQMPQLPLETLRASELLTTSGQLLKLPQDYLVEFRRGDELPVTLDVRGNLFSTAERERILVKVEKDFWVQVQSDNVLVSFDGTTFKPFRDSIAGTLEVGAGTRSTDDPRATQISVLTELIQRK